MNQKTTQFFFVTLIILSVFVVAYVVYDFITVTNAVEVKNSVILFDSGTYYLLLMSIFWVLGVIQYSGLRNKESKILKFGNQVIVIWFIFTLLLANLIPLYLANKFEEAGYVKCKDIREISRVSRGESIIYKIGAC